MQTQHFRSRVPFVAVGIMVICATGMLFAREYLAAAMMAGQVCFMFCLTYSAAKSTQKKAKQRR